MTSNNVDFPEPIGPVSPTVWPAGTERLTLSIAMTSRRPHHDRRGPETPESRRRESAPARGSSPVAGPPPALVTFV